MQSSAHNAPAATAPLRSTGAVALILPTYLPESFGGAEQQSRKMALALGKLGVRVHLIAPRLRKGTRAHERDGTIETHRMWLRHAPNLGGRHMVSLLSWTAKLSWWLTKHRRDYDIIHVIHGRLHALPAVLIGTVLRKPTLIKIGRGGEGHFDIDLLQHKRLLGRWYARVIVGLATAYVANSEQIANDLRRWGIPADRIHRIPNGVGIPELSTTPSSPDGQMQLIYLGRLDVEKSLDIMIRGFARLPGTATLTLVGDGECRADLEKLARGSAAAGRIRFTGPLRDVSVPLGEADVFVSTSSSEGMSNSLLEAMSHGLMPLVSQVSGTSDIVEDGQCGLLFSAGDEEAFVSALQRAAALTPDERRAMGLRARSRVASRFGIDRVAALHVVLYDSLRQPLTATAR